MLFRSEDIQTLLGDIADSERLELWDFEAVGAATRGQETFAIGDAGDDDESPEREEP